jgi:hypothetical protein
VLLSRLVVFLWRDCLLPSPIPVVTEVLVATSMLGIVTTLSRSPASTTGRLDAWTHEVIACSASNAPLVKIPAYTSAPREANGR